MLQAAQAVPEAVTTTEMGLRQVGLTGDSLIPGTQPPRAYQRAVEEEAGEAGQFDIDPETEGLMDRVIEEAEL